MKELKHLSLVVLAALICFQILEAQPTSEHKKSVVKVKQEHAEKEKANSELLDKSEYMTGVKAK